MKSKSNLIITISSLFLLINTSSANDIKNACDRAGYDNKECHVYVNCTGLDILGIGSYGWTSETDPVANGGIIVDPGIPGTNPQNPTIFGGIAAMLANGEEIPYHGVNNSNKLSNTLFNDGTLAHYPDLLCKH